MTWQNLVKTYDIKKCAELLAADPQVCDRLIRQVRGDRLRMESRELAVSIVERLRRSPATLQELRDLLTKELPESLELALKKLETDGKVEKLYGEWHVIEPRSHEDAEPRMEALS